MNRAIDVDSHGVRYVFGNRASRAAMRFKEAKLKPIKLINGPLLPKELRVKGKSKFVSIRLREEGKKHISELYTKKQKKALIST